jgi:four helix bundle protein
MRDLQSRTKTFALDVIRLCARLPQKQEFWIIGKQLMRSATSVGANHRSACRARSKADFIAKLSIVEEEADESIYWLELSEELGMGQDKELQRLKDEANQLVAIVVASKKTARKNVE